MSDAHRQPRPRDRRFLLWVGESLRLALAFAVLSLLARTVQTTALGAYLSVTAVVLLAPRLLDSGLPHAFGYYLRVDARGLGAARRLVARHLVLSAPLALSTAFALRYFPYADDSVNRLVASHWLELALLIVSELGLLLGLAMLIPTARYASYLCVSLLPPLLFLTALWSWPWAAPEPEDLLRLLLATSLAGSLTLGVLLSRVVGNDKPRPAFPVRAAYLYGAKSAGSALAKIIAQRFDRLFLASVLGSTGYAHYSLAISFRDMALFPANLYATTLRNRQIDLATKQRDLAGARRLLLRASGAWLALALVAAMALLPFWADIVRLAMGRDFEPTAEFLRVVAFSCGPLAAMGYAWNHLYALHLPGRVTVLTCGSLALAAPLFWLLIESLGPAVGVAWAVVAWSAAGAAASLGWAMVSMPSDTGASSQA